MLTSIILAFKSNSYKNIKYIMQINLFLNFYPKWVRYDSGRIYDNNEEYLHRPYFQFLGSPLS